MMYEFILLQYNSIEERTERKYGVIFGHDDSDALATLGKYYDILRIEYFACVSEDVDDRVYELNDPFADTFRTSGRRFKKFVPVLNDLPENTEIYE